MISKLEALTYSDGSITNTILLGDLISFSNSDETIETFGALMGYNTEGIFVKEGKEILHFKYEDIHSLT